jgi:predicted MPP superfamily phosphohydrolase
MAYRLTVFSLLFLFVFLRIGSSQLRFVNGKFKIIQFTDLHFGPNPLADAASLKQQELLLDIEKPNLVVLSGDAVSGNQNIDFDRIWTVLTEPMKQRGIPWAYVNGNHDVEGKLNGSQIVELDQRIGGLTRHGPPGTTGASNYVISINSMNNEDLVANIYFFDSMRLGCYVNKDVYTSIRSTGTVKHPKCFELDLAK